MPDSLRVIHDTLVIKQFSDLDVLDKVNTFYTSSWDRLIITVSIAFGIVGIVMPLIIQWYQKKTLQLSEDNLKALIISEIENTKEELKSDFSKRLEDVIITYDAKIENLIYETYAQAYHLQSRINYDSKKYVDAFIDIIDAGSKYLHAQKYDQVKAILKAIDEIILIEIKPQELKAIKKEYKDSLEETLNTLTKQDDEEISKSAIDILNKYNSMMK